MTSSATPTVRRVTVRKTSSVTTRTTLSPVTVCTTAPVNELVVQNAETSSTASEPRYATTSQAMRRHQQEGQAQPTVPEPRRGAGVSVVASGAAVTP